LSLLSVQEISQPAANRSLDLKRKGNLLDFLPREEKGLYIPALGLVLKEVLGREGSCINFRRGEFIYGKGARAARRRFYTLGVVGLLILCMGLLDLYLHYYFKEARYQAFRSDLRQAFVGMFPETKTIVDEVQQANTALGEMKKRLARLGSGEVTPLKILAELTSRIPKEAQIEVQELIIDHEKVRIEAEASSFDSIDKIKMALEGFENIKEVDISDARVGADQNRVKFRINLIWREGL
jgi:type II secretory pathway component PulL